MLEKTVTLYFMDKGDLNGRIECTIGNWEGAVYKIPRAKKKWSTGNKFTIRERLEQSGIYFLFGKTKTGEKTVYVGQAGDKNSGDGAWTRVCGGHTKDARKEDIDEGIKIDDWKEAVIVVHAKAASFLGGVGLNYLENKFYWIANKADEAGYYKMLNGNEPNSARRSIRDGDKSEADDFAEHVKTVMRVLGYGDLFKASDDDVDKGNKNIFRMKGHKTRVKKTDKGYVLLKGSWISSEEDTDNLPGKVLQLREECKDKISADNVLTSDITEHPKLNTPTTLTEFVTGCCPASGNWVNSDGISLKELEKEELQDDE